MAAVEQEKPLAARRLSSREGSDNQNETPPDGRRNGPATGFGLVYVYRCRGLSSGEYSLVLTVVVLLLLAAKGFVRGRAGHTRTAIRGIDVATETIGIRPLRTKLLAPLGSTARSRYQCERRY
jgi:hypothetical protein